MKFFDQMGRLKQTFGLKKHKIKCQVSISNHDTDPTVKRGVYLSIPRKFADELRYDIFMSRSPDGWACISFNKDGRYKVRASPTRARMYIPSLLGAKNKVVQLDERDWVVTNQAFYFKIPAGATETRRWWKRMPDVPEQPWEKHAELLDVLQQMRSSDGDEVLNDPMLRGDE